MHRTHGRRDGALVPAAGAPSGVARGCVWRRDERGRGLRVAVGEHRRVCACDQEGIGTGAVALSTADATHDAIANADMLVAGAPLLGFRLPTESMREGTRHERVPPDLAAPSMRAWLAGLPRGTGRAAAFETRYRWSPGGGTRHDRGGAAHPAGYTPVAKAERFLVTGRYGPLKDGELDRAREWGASLARALREDAADGV